MTFNPLEEYAHRHHSMERIRHEVEILQDPGATLEQVRAAGMTLRDVGSDVTAHFRLRESRRHDITPEGIRIQDKLRDIFQALNPCWVDKARNAGL